MILTVESDVLARVVRDAVADAMGRHPATRKRAMISASEADRLYRRAKGTAATSYRAGLVRGEERQGASRTGRVIWIRAADAERLWAGGRAVDLGQRISTGPVRASAIPRTGGAA